MPEICYEKVLTLETLSTRNITQTWIPTNKLGNLFKNSRMNFSSERFPVCESVLPDLFDEDNKFVMIINPGKLCGRSQLRTKPFSKLKTSFQQNSMSSFYPSGSRFCDNGAKETQVLTT